MTCELSIIIQATYCLSDTTASASQRSLENVLRSAPTLPSLRPSGADDMTCGLSVYAACAGSVAACALCHISTAHAIHNDVTVMVLCSTEMDVIRTRVAGPRTPKHRPIHDDADGLSARFTGVGDRLCNNEHQEQCSNTIYH